VFKKGQLKKGLYNEKDCRREEHYLHNHAMSP